MDEKLAALGQTQEDYLPSEIEKFKDATGYEEFLDFDPAEVKAALDDSEKSHADEMPVSYTHLDVYKRQQLRFEEVEKRPNGRLRHNPLSRPVHEIVHAAHAKVHEVEQENVGVEGICIEEE